MSASAAGAIHEIDDVTKESTRPKAAWRGPGVSQVMVMRGSRASFVDLRHLYIRDLGTARVVSLADVWVAAQLPGDLFELSFDFIGDDGGRSSSSHGTKLDCARFVRAYLDVNTRDLMWQDGDEGSAYVVEHVATIVADEV